MIYVSIGLYLFAYFSQRIFIILPFDNGYNLIYHIVRYFPFNAFPFLFIGYYISNKLQNNNLIVYKKWLLMICIIGIVLLFTEKIIMEKYYAYYFRSDYLFSLIFLCPALFLFVLSISQYKGDDGYVSKLSSGVYFTHLLVIDIFAMLSINGNIPFHVLFIVLLFISVVFSASIIELNKRIKIFL